MSEHAQILIVLLPLLAAPLAALMRTPDAAWTLATAVAWSVLSLAVLLLLQVQAQGVLSYAIGGWAAKNPSPSSQLISNTSEMFLPFHVMSRVSRL